MPAYVVVDVEVLDRETFDQYRALVPETISRYGGRYLVRGGDAETLEGTWKPSRLVILEFPTREQALAWSNSTEYAGPRALRQAAARSEMIVVDGV